MNQAKEIERAQIELLENRNPLLAEKILLKVANQENGHASHELGILYLHGNGELSANKEKALYWLEKSVELGFEKTIASDPYWFKNNAN